jgi:transglutaminase-like putative cysteine protease
MTPRPRPAAFWRVPLLLLLLSGLGSAGRGAGRRAVVPDLPERWYVVVLGGTPVGYLHETQSGEPAAGFTMDSVLLMVINRLGSRVELSVTSRVEEAPDGRIRRTSSETKASTLVMKSSAVVGDRTIEIRSEAGGKSYVRTIPCGGELLGPEGLRRRSLAAVRRPGDVLEYQTYTDELEKTVKGKRTCLGREKIMVLGREVDALKTEESLEGTGSKATAWLDGGHEAVRLETPTPFGQAEFIRATREQALAAAGGGSLSEEIYARSIIRTAVRLPQARTMERMKVRLTRRVTDTNWPDLAGPGQKVLSGTEKTLVLEVRRPAAVRPVRLPLPSAPADRPYLIANSVIQSDDPALRAATAKILAGEKNAWTAALKLRRWVSENMTFDAGIALAPSSELFKDRHGTCLGYATLLATMARAAGLPSRVVIGYVYLLGIFGGHAWTEVRVGESWLPLDAAVVSPGVADAARVGIAASSLYEGSGSLTGGAASELLGQVEIRILEYAGEDGKAVTVPENAKPYLIEGDVYRNPWLGLSLTKPQGFAFGRLDAVWPDATVVEISGPGGAKASMQEGYFFPWVKPELAAAQALVRFTGPGQTGRATKDGRTVLSSTKGDKAAAAIVDGAVYWLLTSSGDNAADVLSALLRGLSFLK